MAERIDVRIRSAWVFRTVGGITAKWPQIVIDHPGSFSDITDAEHEPGSESEIELPGCSAERLTAIQADARYRDKIVSVREREEVSPR